MQQFVKSTSTYFSLSFINLVTIETFIDFEKLQLLGLSCADFRVDISQNQCSCTDL